LAECEKIFVEPFVFLVLIFCLHISKYLQNDKSEKFRLF